MTVLWPSSELIVFINFFMYKQMTFFIWLFIYSLFYLPTLSIAVVICLELLVNIVILLDSIKDLHVNEI